MRLLDRLGLGGWSLLRLSVALGSGAARLGSLGDDGVDDVGDNDLTLVVVVGVLVGWGSDGTQGEEKCEGGACVHLWTIRRTTPIRDGRNVWMPGWLGSREVVCWLWKKSVISNHRD